MKILLDLFLTFAKIGLFTFGGGYAMIAMIDDTCVNRKKWLTHDEMINMTVIAESTPGPIAINCATFTGYKMAGVIGSVSATLGMVTPSFVVIYLISMFLDNFLEIAIVASAFKGIKVGIAVLIIDAAITMLKKMQKKCMPILILISSCIAMLCINLFSLRFSSVAVMLVVALFSLSIYSLKIWRAKK